MWAATVVRAGMAALGVVHAWWGLWARFWPRHFYDTFPGLGRRWTAAYPPYNEHLVTDLGATFLTLAFLLLAGAVRRKGSTAARDERGADRAELTDAAKNRTVRAVALVAVALFGALHLGFHAGDPGTLAGVDLGASLVFLILGVLTPVALLVIDRVGQRSGGQRSGGQRSRGTP